jgi:hypothetical protein
MKWLVLPRVFPEQQVWGSHYGAFSYVISCDHKRGAGADDNEYIDRYAASAAPLGKLPFVSGRVDLGVYDSFVLAEQACVRHARQSRQ